MTSTEHAQCESVYPCIEISPHLTGDSCTTLWIKNLLEIALSLTVFEIFVIFHIFTKSSNKVAITHLYIEQQVSNLNMLQFTKKYMNNIFQRNRVAAILLKI